MSTILHITTPDAWNEALATGLYRGDTLATEGFIHCSTAAQVVRVADARFGGRAGLVLLCIDADRVGSDVRYEPAEAGELFPHIYGPLNIDAVALVVPFEPGPDGRFALPRELEAKG